MLGNITAGNIMFFGCVVFFILGTVGIIRNAITAHKANKMRKQYMQACKNSDAE